MFGLSGEDFKKLDKNFNALTSRFNNKFEEMTQQFEQLQKNITKKINSLHSTGGAILDEPGLQDLANSVTESIAEHQARLASAVDMFKEAINEYGDKARDLTAREQAIVAREKDADNDFAIRFSGHITKMLNLERASSDKQEDLLNKISTILKNYEEHCDALRKQNIEDFQKVSAAHENGIEQLQKDLSSQLEKIIVKTNELNDRQAELVKREDEVRGGLQNERAKMIETIEIERQHIKEQEENLSKEKHKLENEWKNIEEKRKELADREQEVLNRETIADNEFPEKRSKMCKEIDEYKDKSINLILDEENNARKRRENAYSEFLVKLDEERNQRQKALRESLAKIEADVEKECARRRSELNERQDFFDQQQKGIEDKIKDLNAREQTIEIKKSELLNLIEFNKEQREIDCEKFRKIADERINAVNEIKQATENARDSLARECLNLRLKYEEQLSINNRFRDKSPEEIYTKINLLEGENERLKARLANAMVQPNNHNKTDIQIQGEENH